MTTNNKYELKLYDVFKKKSIHTDNNLSIDITYGILEFIKYLKKKNPIFMQEKEKEYIINSINSITSSMKNLNNNDSLKQYLDNPNQLIVNLIELLNTENNGKVLTYPTKYTRTNGNFKLFNKPLNRTRTRKKLKKQKKTLKKKQINKLQKQIINNLRIAHALDLYNKKKRKDSDKMLNTLVNLFIGDDINVDENYYYISCTRDYLSIYMHTFLDKVVELYEEIKKSTGTELTNNNSELTNNPTRTELTNNPTGTELTNNKSELTNNPTRTELTNNKSELTNNKSVLNTTNILTLMNRHNIKYSLHLVKSEKNINKYINEFREKSIDNNIINNYKIINVNKNINYNLLNIISSKILIPIIYNINIDRCDFIFNKKIYNTKLNNKNFPYLVYSIFNEYIESDDIIMMSKPIGTNISDHKYYELDTKNNLLKKNRYLYLGFFFNDKLKILAINKSFIQIK